MAVSLFGAADANSLHEAALSRIETLKDNKQQLVRAFVYERCIDKKPIKRNWAD